MKVSWIRVIAEVVKAFGCLALAVGALLMTAGCDPLTTSPNETPAPTVTVTLDMDPVV